MSYSGFTYESAVPGQAGVLFIACPSNNRMNRMFTCVSLTPLTKSQSLTHSLPHSTCSLLSCDQCASQQRSVLEEMHQSSVLHASSASHQPRRHYQDVRLRYHAHPHQACPRRRALLHPRRRAQQRLRRQVSSLLHLHSLALVL